MHCVLTLLMYISISCDAFQGQLICVSLVASHSLSLQACASAWKSLFTYSSCSKIWRSSSVRLESATVCV
jgi:hypothetical protein